MRKAISARPKYLLIGAVSALLASSLLLAPSASAHGTCSLRPWEPIFQRDPQATWFGATVTCSAGTVHSISVTATGWRRTPGQAWVQVWGPVNDSTPPGFTGTQYSVSGTISTFNCAKDYKTSASFAASPGPHSIGGSTIRYHSC